jgi:hypothetical protein
MKKLTENLAAGFGLVAGAAAIAVTYLGHRLAGLPFLPFDIFDWLARTLPGSLIARTIDAMVAVIRGLRLGPTASTAKMAEQSLALGQFALTWIILSAVVAAAGRRRPRRLTFYGMIGGLVLFATAAGIEGSRGFSGSKPLAAVPWLVAVLVGGGALLGRALAAASGTPEASPQAEPARRRFLRLVGTGSFVVIVTAAGVSLLSKKNKKLGPEADQEELAEAAKSSGPAASPPSAELSKRFPPVPGTRPGLAPQARRPGRASSRPVTGRPPVQASANAGSDPLLHLQSRRRGPHRHELLDRNAVQGAARRGRAQRECPGDRHRVRRRLL